MADWANRLRQRAISDTVSEGSAQQHGPAGPDDARELRRTPFAVCDVVPRQEQ